MKKSDSLFVPVLLKITTWANQDQNKKVVRVITQNKKQFYSIHEKQNKLSIDTKRLLLSESNPMHYIQENKLKYIDTITISITI